MEVLKLDLDSFECHVLEYLLPFADLRAVVLEINPIFPPPIGFARYWGGSGMGDELDLHPLHGCSLTHAVSG